MKALVVEDNLLKQGNVIRLLEKIGITDYCVEKFVAKAIEKAMHMKFDILITDLGLPRFIDHPYVEDEREGLKMMYDLGYEKIIIPTIIYSSTEIFPEQVEYLKEMEYPFLGQVEEVSELEIELRKFITSTK